MSESGSFFLEVEKSISGQAWIDRVSSPRRALAIAQKFDLPEIVARILAARDVGLDDVETWLSPTLRELMPSPDVVMDLQKGAARIVKALEAGETIAIIGDYDVDGISSTTILTQFLQAAGAAPVFHIPDRITEGYGPSIMAVEKLAGEGAKLLITLDCGIASHQPLARARELGLDTIIVDHHQVPQVIPDHFAAINPNRNDDLSGLGYLCAAGVTMMLIATLNKQLREVGWWDNKAGEAPDILQYLDLVALATVCDVVPLTGLNRAFVRHGLKIMASRNRTGLAALMDAARLARKPDVYALGFVIGPRINAAGRIGTARTGIELLCENDRGKANQIAAKLEGWNRERQAIELGVIDKADLQAQAAFGKNANLPVLVVSGNGWHPGVLGLAAARLKERYNVPSFVLGIDKNGSASGSGRSIKGVDLGSAVAQAVERGIISKGGGHAMAAGLTIDEKNLGQLRAFMEEALAKPTALARQNRALKIDAAVTASGANLELIEKIERAGPFGAANPAPMFALPSHRVVYADIAGTDHVRCTLAAPDGSRIKAIAFRVADTELGETLLTERAMPLHFAGRLAINEWGGRREPQLLISDVARVK